MLDENKQQNKLGELKQNHIPLSINDVSIFKDNPSLIYLYKKTEKLVSALYMLSGFISDKEPVKWQMREMGVNLLSQGLSLSNRLSSERRLAYANFISTGLKFLSFLEVSYAGGIISEMNFNILKYEFESLIQMAESVEIGDNKGLIFSDHFFDVPQTGPIVPNNVSLTPPVINKGQNIMSDTKHIQTASRSESKRKDKSNRQDIIISLLKKNTELGIKDITASIGGCGEKTIQRELVSLVSKGLIKKAGEKRWSRYSLK